jgi:hypothetical protein
MLVAEMQDRISGMAWNAMLAECRLIWSREGVDVVTRGDGPPAQVILPLVFDDRQLRVHDRGSRDTFGITQFHGRSQRIVISAPKARRVIELRRGLADSGDSSTLDVAFGKVLGRVLAHEIGHALLLTMLHSERGLMEAHLSVRDALSTDADLVLSARERDRLAQRFSTGQDAAPSLALAAAATH